MKEADVEVQCAEAPITLRLDSLGLSHTGVQIDWRPYGNL